MSESKVVRKKKKWGKIYSYTPVTRATILTEEKAEEIKKDLAKPYVTTASAFANKHQISVGLAKKILKDSKFTLVHGKGKSKIYS